MQTSTQPTNQQLQQHQHQDKPPSPTNAAAQEVDLSSEQLKTNIPIDEIQNQTKKTIKKSLKDLPVNPS